MGCFATLRLDAFDTAGACELGCLSKERVCNGAAISFRDPSVDMADCCNGPPAERRICLVLDGIFEAFDVLDIFDDFDTLDSRTFSYSSRASSSDSVVISLVSSSALKNEKGQRKVSKKHTIKARISFEDLRAGLDDELNI